MRHSLFWSFLLGGFPDTPFTEYPDLRPFHSAARRNVGCLHFQIIGVPDVRTSASPIVGSPHFRISSALKLRYIKMLRHLRHPPPLSLSPLGWWAPSSFVVTRSEGLARSWMKAPLYRDLSHPDIRIPSSPVSGYPDLRPCPFVARRNSGCPGF